MPAIKMPNSLTDPTGNLYRIDFDPSSQIVRARANGFWQPSDVVRFGEDVKAFILASNRQLGFARVLFDRRDSGVQSRETAEAIRTDSRIRLGPQDRLALVFDFAIAKMQVQRVVDDHKEIRSFTDFDEAEAWLKEWCGV